MKLFTLILAAAIAAMPAMAAHKKGEIISPEPAVKNVQAGQKKIDIKAKNLGLENLRSHKIASRAEEPEVIIPSEGRTQNYVVTSAAYSYGWFGLEFSETDGLKEVVWGDDGKVYIKGFGILPDCYTVGEYTDGEITVKFPQPVYELYEGEMYFYYLTVMELAGDAENLVYVNVDEDKNEVKFAVKEDGSIEMLLNPDYSYSNFEENSELPQYIIGLCEDPTPGLDDAWLGYGEALQTYVEFNEMPVALPESVEPETWVIIGTDEFGNTISQTIDVALDGNDIYLGTIDYEFPCWAKGTIADGIATFESGQYEGVFSSYLIYFMAGKYSVQIVEEDGDEWEEFNVDFADAISFKYDAEKKTLTSINDDDCIVLNVGKDEFYFYLAMALPSEIKWQDPELCNAAPLDPVCKNYQPWDPEFFGGQGAIMWAIPNVNVNGAVLDTDQMYYHFIVDDEVYALDPEEYVSVPEYMEDIPYNFTDGWDVGANGEDHTIYFYFEGAESFGLQSFYVSDNGETYASNIVTFVPESGIAAVAADTVSTKCYDITGREVVAPKSGLVIKVSKLSDGSIRTEKVIIK